MEKNAKIYVAGHLGLVGGAILRCLRKKGYANIITRTHTDLNLIDQKAVNAFFEEEKPEYVFLAAARVGGIIANSQHPANFIYENMMIAFNVIHGAYKTGTRKLMNLGTTCIYPKESAQPIKEDYLLTGPLEKTNDSYALAKISAIKFCTSMNEQYGTNFLSVMPCSLYGPGDSYDPENSHVLPAMIHKFHTAKHSHKDKVLMWGDGSPLREFLFSDDLAEAVVYLLVGFVCLCIGYIAVNFKLFYVMFVLKTPLNRSIISHFPPVTTALGMIKIWIAGWKDYGLFGFYHAPSLQTKVIIPLDLILTILCALRIISAIQTDASKVKIISKLKAALEKTDTKIKLLFVLNITAVIFACLAGLYDSYLLSGFFKRYIPVLFGFNWGRVWILNRVLWYVIFALCIDYVLHFNECFNGINKRVCKWIAAILICLQLFVIVKYHSFYGDTFKTWYNEFGVKTGIAAKLFPGKNFDEYISYKEFYAEDLFDKIKKDIGYSGEKVAAFGYHPAVLMYNGFNCIDGYNNAYPLSYMRRFRRLIAPELEINKTAREYYDSWGGRMYLYSSDFADSQPTKIKDAPPRVLNIDMHIFNNDFGAKYILSRTEILNADKLGLHIVKRYYDENSIYTIYLYSV